LHGPSPFAGAAALQRDPGFIFGASTAKIIGAGTLPGCAEGASISFYYTAFLETIAPDLKTEIYGVNIRLRSVGRL
jgi:hypothetical protein